MPFYISHQDITTIEADAIVNAANTGLREGGGVCGAIFKAAGRKEMTAACREIGGVSTGEAVITKGFALPARYVIHTAGPVWKGTEKNEKELYSCYEKSLRLALHRKLTSIAFPLISSGLYGCPRDMAFTIARKAILDFLDKHPGLRVTLILLEPVKDPQKKKLFEALRDMLKSHQIEEITADSIRKSCLSDTIEGAPLYSSKLTYGSIPPVEMPCNECADAIFPIPLEPSFTELLFRLIDERGLTDPMVYKAANLDRRFFSKVRNAKEDYTPKKINVLALAVALKLSVKETESLLESAGYSLSRSKKLDLIVRWFINQKNYDIYAINEMLERFGEKQLGG